jgi:hypothetical protein
MVTVPVVLGTFESTVTVSVPPSPGVALPMLAVHVAFAATGAATDTGGAITGVDGNAGGATVGGGATAIVEGGELGGRSTRADVDGRVAVGDGATTLVGSDTAGWGTIVLATAEATPAPVGAMAGGRGGSPEVVDGPAAASSLTVLDFFF